jgi:hypothetical protein
VIKANHLEVLVSGSAFPGQQFIGSYQETIAFGLLLPSVGDWIDLDDFFASIFEEASDQ